jgi:hypothetical protein
MIEIDLEQAEHTLTSDEKLQAWGPGEWVEEADRFKFEYKGYNCLVIRIYEKHNGIIELGHLCGYVQIPKGHVWHGKESDQIDCQIHGGLTFGHGDFMDNYVIGFDCGHSGDITPGTERVLRESRLKLPQWMHHAIRYSPIFQGSYKNMNFVIEEIKSLVDQAIESNSKIQSGLRRHS